MFVKVAQKSEISAGGCHTVDVGGTPVALFNVDGSYHAIHDTCLHRQGSLGKGELDGNLVTCPLHGWEWDVTTGENSDNPEVRVQRFECRVEGDDILVSETPLDE